MNNLVQHHVKYKELHGIDEIVMMTYGEHKKLHNRLRVEGKCKIPVKELYEISSAAYKRTEKHKKFQKEYSAKVEQRIAFYTPLIKYVRLHELLIYNTHTGNICWSASFEGKNGHTLKIIDVEEEI